MEMIYKMRHLLEQEEMELLLEMTILTHNFGQDLEGAFEKIEKLRNP